MEKSFKKNCGHYISCDALSTTERIIVRVILRENSIVLLEFGALYEESLEFEVAEIDLNVPWAQQAEKKSLNVGYQNQTLRLKYIVTLA